MTSTALVGDLRAMAGETLASSVVWRPAVRELPWSFAAVGFEEEWCWTFSKTLVAFSSWFFVSGVGAASV